MSTRVRVNPIACEAHGMCAELLPERISLDPWGYPIVDGAPLRGEEVEHAVRAARACPTFALLLERDQPRAPRPAGAGSAGSQRL
jgi:ferredoxin